MNRISFFARGMIVVCLMLASVALGQPRVEKPVTLGVAAKDFQFHGDWSFVNDHAPAHGTTPVLVSPPRGFAHPAATGVTVPRAGKYKLWVCSRDFPEDRPGTRTFRVRVGNDLSETVFGKAGVAWYGWQEGGEFELPAGPVLIVLEAAQPFARAQGVVLTNDPKFKPGRMVGTGGFAATTPLTLNGTTGAAAEEELVIGAERPAATLSNANIQIEFVPAKRGTRATLAVRARVKTGDRWAELPQDPAAEGYFAITCPADAKLTYGGFYPTWNRSMVQAVTVEAGGNSVKTTTGRVTHAMWDAGAAHRQIPRAAQMKGNTVEIDFYPSPAGQMRATWTLAPEAHTARVELSFTPEGSGQVALGYELFLRRDLRQVNEVLLPMMYQRHRLPERECTLLDNVAPTPLAMVEAGGAEVRRHEGTEGKAGMALGVCADPQSIPFGWSDGKAPHYALGIKDRAGKVQPSIWGPVIGTPAAAAQAGKPIAMRFHVVLQGGDWYAGFRTVVDEVFAVRDYRSNVGTSLSDAAYNMIDLLMDDQFGGWWERAKSFYQIETKNGGTLPSPMLFLSLYRLTGDPEVYRRRALPSIEFMISRDGPHFSPFPEDTGPYPAGSMNGPVKLYGTTAFGGLWELAGRRTAALGAIALPGEDVRSTAGYSHAQEFDEWLSRYLLTRDQKDLDKACELADAYLKRMLTNPPRKDLGPMPFFFIHFTPDWEGLLWMYEVTGKKQYLDGAVFGARQVMTGLWCHPQFPAGDTTIHQGGQYSGDGVHLWWRGGEKYRLGWPRKANDTPEKSVPAWTVSAVGLGFEQPSTVRASGDARLIYQMYFAPHFLRLYRYTKDPAFITCARNAVVGRFASYPGYYVTGHTDLPLNPDYPKTGPDVSSIYYHHIAPHLAWTIDYLVSEAEMLSDGQIRFPALRQNGYAYFDSRIYGHAAGKVYDDEAAWLLLRRGLVTLDNPQINCLLAHSASKLHLILTNQSAAAQEVNVGPVREKLGLGTGGIDATLRVGGKTTEYRISDASRKIALPPRGLAVLSLAGVKIDAPARVQRVEGALPTQPIQTLKDGNLEVRATAIQADPGAWSAYVWLNASPREVKSATLHYAIGDTWKSIEDTEYPFEFSVPSGDDKSSVKFRVDITRANGMVSATGEGVVGLEGKR